MVGCVELLLGAGDVHVLWMTVFDVDVDAATAGSLLLGLLGLFLCEERLVLLLRLDECLLEEVCVCQVVSPDQCSHPEHLLSLLAKRIASVCASGSPSLTSAAAFHTQLRSLPTLGDSFISGTT